MERIGMHLMNYADYYHNVAVRQTKPIFCMHSHCSEGVKLILQIWYMYANLLWCLYFALVKEN